MATFDDLIFHPYPSPPYSPPPYYEKATIAFPNGYGASVIHAAFDSRYEVGVMIVSEDTWRVCSHTEIPFNVLSYVSPDEVTNRLQQIEALPKREKEEE